MKKLICILMLAMLVGIESADARIVVSRTFGEKAKGKTEWIIRTGLSINNAAGSVLGDIKKDFIEDEGTASFGPRCGFELSAAFNKPMGKSGLYWGMELGIGSRGASMKTIDNRFEDGSYYENSKKHISTWNLKYSPFTLGYKYPLTEMIRLDVHLGAYASYDFAGSGSVTWERPDDTYEESENIGKDTLHDFQRFDAGIQAGIGIWYGRFNFDITYQRGFVNAYDDLYDEFGWGTNIKENAKIYSSNLMLRVGFAF